MFPLRYPVVLGWFSSLWSVLSRPGHGVAAWGPSSLQCWVLSIGCSEIWLRPQYNENCDRKMQTQREMQVMHPPAAVPCSPPLWQNGKFRFLETFYWAICRESGAQIRLFIAGWNRRGSTINWSAILFTCFIPLPLWSNNFTVKSFV